MEWGCSGLEWNGMQWNGDVRTAVNESAHWLQPPVHKVLCLMLTQLNPTGSQQSSPVGSVASYISTCHSAASNHDRWLGMCNGRAFEWCSVLNTIYTMCGWRESLKEQEADLKCALLELLVHIRAKVLLKTVAEKPAECSTALATSQFVVSV